MNISISCVILTLCFLSYLLLKLLYFNLMIWKFVVKKSSMSSRRNSRPDVSSSVKDFNIQKFAFGREDCLEETGFLTNFLYVLQLTLLALYF